MATKEDKTQGKEGEDKSIFLRFGDDLAVDDKPHRVWRGGRKTGTSRVIEGSRMEVADGFADNAGTHPSRRIPGGIGQIAPRDANSYVIVLAAILIHKKAGNGSAGAGNSDCGRVGGAGGKDGVRANAARNSITHRVDVFDVGTGKQGRKRELAVVGRVGVVNVAVIVGRFPSVSRGVVSRGSDVPVVVRGGGAAKNPNGLVGVVLAGIDVNHQLRLALLQRNERKR